MSYHGPKPGLDNLTVVDFPQQPVHVTFADNSIVRLRNAFYRREGEWLAVYSEHCGYHMFPMPSVETVKGMARVTE